MQLLSSLIIPAFLFSIIGLGAGLWACVQVLAWKRSTHRIEYRNREDSSVEHDLPQAALDQMPTKPTPQTLQQYMAELREQDQYLLDSESEHNE